LFKIYLSLKHQKIILKNYWHHSSIRARLGLPSFVETTTDKTGKDKHAGYYCILLSKCLLLVLLENSPGGKNPKVKLSFLL